MWPFSSNEDKEEEAPKTIKKVEPKKDITSGEGYDIAFEGKRLRVLSLFNVGDGDRDIDNINDTYEELDEHLQAGFEFKGLIKLDTDYHGATEYIDVLLIKPSQ